MDQLNSTDAAERTAAAIGYVNVTCNGAPSGSDGGGGSVPPATELNPLIQELRLIREELAAERVRKERDARRAAMHHGVLFGEAIAPKVVQDQATRGKVEILFHGGRRLVFVNGRQVRQVLSIETPRSLDEVAGIVELRFIASEIVEREISREQFDALMKG